MGLSMRELMTLDIVAKDDATPTVQRVSGAIASSGLAYKQASIRALTYSKVLRGLSKGLTIYGAAALGIVAASTKVAVSFEKDMSLVHTQTDIGAKAFKNVETSVLNLSEHTSRPLSELTQGLYDIFSGVKTNGRGAIRMLTSVAKAAQAGNTDIRTAVRAVIAEENAFGMSTGATNKILDQQFQLLRYSTGTYDELTSAIGMVMPSARAAGQNLLQVNTALGFLTKSGFSFSEAATRTSRALDYLTRPKIATALHNTLGVEIFNAKGNVRDLNKVITDMGKKMQGFTEEQRKNAFADIFGAGEIRANSFFNLAVQGWQRYNQELKDVGNSQGALQRANQKVAHTAAVLWGEVLNTLRVIGIQIGNAILPTLEKFLGYVSQALSWFQKLSPAVKSTVAQFLLWSGIIAIILGRVAKLGAGLLSIVSMRLWSGMQAEAEGAARGIGALARTIGSTVGRFTLWAGLIAGAAYLIYKNWGTVKTWFAGFVRYWQDLWRKVWDAVRPIVQFLAHAFREVATEIGAFALTAGGALAKFIGWLVGIKPVVQGVVIFLLTLLAVRLVAGIKTALTTIYEAFVAFGTRLGAAIRANWVTIMIAALVTAAVLIIQNWAKVRDFFSKIFNGIERDAVAVGNFFLRYLVNPIIQGINTIIHALNAVSLGLASISTIKPIQQMTMPNKYVSNVGAAASSTNAASDATGSLSNNAAAASGNIAKLNDVIKAYTGQATKAGKSTTQIDKHIKGLKDAMDSQVRSLMRGAGGLFDLTQSADNLMRGPWGNGQVTNAAKLQAAAIMQVYNVQKSKLSPMLRSLGADGKTTAAYLANMGDVSIKIKSRFASLLGTVSSLGLSFNRNQLAIYGNALATHQLSPAIKMMQGMLDKASKSIKGMPDKKKVKIDADTKGLSGQITEQGQKLNKLGKMNVKPKVTLNTKQLAGQITEQGTALNKLGKVTAKPKVALDPAVFKREINNVVHMIDTTDKMTAKPKVDADTTAANSKIATTQGAANRLNSTRVNIPISVSSVSDPYAYGYAIGQKVAAGARAALQQRSPSKVFIAIGKNVIRGLIIGLRDAALLDELAGSVKKITGIVKTMPGMLMATFRLLNKGTANALNTATNSFQKFMDKVANLQTAIGDLRDKIRQHISDIKGKLKDLDKTINDKTTKAAAKAAAILQKNKLTDQLKKWMDVSDLPNTLGAVARKLSSWGNDLQHRMNALNQRVQSFTSDFRSGFQQGTDIVSILGGEDKLSKNKIRKFFADKIRDAKSWASVLRQLAKKGLDQNLLQELAAAGPDALPLAKQILDVGVKYVNKQQGVLNQISTSTQKYLVDTVFGSQIDAIAKEAKRFQTVLKQLTDVINRALHPNGGNGTSAPTGGGGGNSNLHYHYHAPRRADAREQMRELSWWWRTHRLGA